MTESEVITRQRKWKPAEKAALPAEVEAEGGKVVMVAWQQGVEESPLDIWRSARKATAPAMCTAAAPKPIIKRRITKAASWVMSPRSRMVEVGLGGKKSANRGMCARPRTCLRPVRRASLATSVGGTRSVVGKMALAGWLPAGDGNAGVFGGGSHAP